MTHWSLKKAEVAKAEQGGAGKKTKEDKDAKEESEEGKGDGQGKKDPEREVGMARRMELEVEAEMASRMEMEELLQLQPEEGNLQGSACIRQPKTWRTNPRQRVFEKKVAA
eukprot:s2809_g3.t1